MARFVVADDSEIPRDILRRIVGQMGHDVVGAAENGKVAVEMCAFHKPDVVILDLSMPVMGGQEAAIIINRDQTAKIIMFASSQSQEAILEPLRKFTKHFTIKPYADAQLQKDIALAVSELDHGDA